jgi:hypothetical protein
VRADIPGYTIQTLARAGTTVGDVKMPAGGYFALGSLNDSSQLAFDIENAAGGEAILRYSGGTFLTIAAGGRTVSGVKWPNGVTFDGDVAMNQSGEMAFRTISGSSNTYRWDPLTGQVSAVAAAGMPATNDLTFTAGADGSPPKINDAGEVAFQGRVKDSTGVSQRGIFFLGRDGKLAPVVLPGQQLADGSTIQLDANAGTSSLSNAGAVGFWARRVGDKSDGCFVWENGTITPVLLPGAAAPGGGTLALVGGGFLNNKNENAFMGGSLDGSSSHIGLYLWSAGQLTAICLSGQTAMPGGGQFLGLISFSASSSAGASAFTARLVGGDSGLYRVDADGKVSLIAKPGDLGAQVVFPDSSGSFGLAINARGQVALPVLFKGDKAESLILLTPASP